jgi:hypothetical protein
MQIKGHMPRKKAKEVAVNASILSEEEVRGLDVGHAFISFH